MTRHSLMITAKRSKEQLNVKRNQ